GVEEGWESGVEWVLRERVQAMEMSDPELLQRLLEDPPPARVSAFSPGAEAELRREAGLTPLADYVKAADPSVGAVVSAWLAPFFTAGSTPPLPTPLGLAPHVALVHRGGPQFRRFRESFPPPEPAHRRHSAPQ